MNAITQPRSQGAAPRALSNAELGAELLREVQLSRAQSMALTRLHFALAGGNRHQAMEAMDRLSIPAAPANPLEAVFKDPHLAAVGMFMQVEHPTEGRVTQLKPPVDYSATPSTIRRQAPRLGEHTEEVLREIGEA